MSKLKLYNLENKMIEIEGRTLYSYLCIFFCFVQFYLFCCCCLLICFLRFYVMLFENPVLKQSLQMYFQQLALHCCQPDGFSYKGGLIIRYYSCSLTMQCFSVHELFIKRSSVFRQNHSNLSAAFSSSLSCSISAMHAHAQKCVVQLEWYCFYVTIYVISKQLVRLKFHNQINNQKLALGNVQPSEL